MDPDRHDIEYDEHERRLFAMLPRDADVKPAGAEIIVDALRAEGFLRQRDVRGGWWLRIAAGIALVLLGGAGGGALARRDSLEAQLARSDLTVADRVLLLQRAGSAYVRAAQSYADATARADSTAVEVANQVLVGAASAVARSKLAGGVASRLTAVLQSSAAPPSRPSVLWY